MILTENVTTYAYPTDAEAAAVADELNRKFAAVPGISYGVAGVDYGDGSPVVYDVVQSAQYEVVDADDFI